MPCALSRNARTLLIRFMSGEEVEATSGAISARRELQRAGLLDRISGRPTLEALRRRREFLPHDGPLSEDAIEQLRRHLARDRDLTDQNRAAYRELAAAMHTFARGDESACRLTEQGFERSSSEWMSSRGNRFILGLSVHLSAAG